jgi:hypothetical protein
MIIEEISLNSKMIIFQVSPTNINELLKIYPYSKELSITCKPLRYNESPVCCSLGQLTVTYGVTCGVDGLCRCERPTDDWLKSVSSYTAFTPHPHPTSPPRERREGTHDSPPHVASRRDAAAPHVAQLSDEQWIKVAVEVVLRHYHGGLCAQE